ncbi:MAG: microcystin degradation protein MlrC [Alphaproteobacteria bacterium]|nr:microcystin degradation protein MlrC [Alphaproteobacteria bacterium]
MRLVLAMLKHETNTFSPIVTDIARFEQWGLHFGPSVVPAFESTAMPLAAYIRIARERGADIVTPVAAEAMPGGRVTREAYERLVAPILEAIENGCDGALLDLHGAMVCEHTDDGEGTLLSRIRAIRPGLPIAVTCDLHANLSAEMVSNCTALIGYKTYPHVDMYAVADKVGNIVLDAMEGKCRPVVAWGRLPLMSQTLRQGTADSPMREIQALAAASEAQAPILCATAFGGFPMADIPIAGNSAIVVADGDGAAAQEAAQALLDAAWAARSEFMHRHAPLAATLARATEVNAAPVVLLDHADNVGSGGTSDVMKVIEEVARQDLDGVAVATVWDPVSVTAMRAAGVGAKVTLDLGGRTPMPSIGLEGRPMRISGTVASLAEGKWRVEGPMYTGVQVNTGPTAVLDTGRMKIVVVSLHHEPWDTGIFTANGIDPARQHFLLLKSRIHYRAGFAPLARATFTLDGDGVTTSDNSRLSFANVSRPVYPLDPGPFAPVRAQVV